MYYKSTRDNSISVGSTVAIAKGLSDEGGLFIPESIPNISLDELERFGKLSYPDLAYEILKLYLGDFSEEEIRHAVKNAYGEQFDVSDAAELSHLMPDTFMLELWHGPTCAFKDMALQILPYLLTTSSKKVNSGKEAVILVATSGDTGKAALEGFCDVDGTRIMVFYPCDGVSDMQKRQMTTQLGKNVGVCAIEGNFDDCQNGVKAIFTNKEVIDKLAENNMVFSSANSINCGRFLPQIVYYFFSYVKLVESGEIKNGDKINFVVPTGNFGNILSAYYAKEMGLPVNKLICASNSNKVLTDFINTGIYDKNRDFITTTSPSMDILISSNLERLIYLLSGNDDEYVKSCFDALQKDGKYQVTDAIKAKVSEFFYGGYCDDVRTKEEISAVFNEYSYLMDTHTAVAYVVYKDYVKATGDNTKTVVVSTANPYKFVDAVYSSLVDDYKATDEFDVAEKLCEFTKMPIPEPILSLKDAEIRFKQTVKKDQMSDVVLDFISGK